MDKIDKLKIILDTIEDLAKEELKNKKSSLIDFKEGQIAAIEIIREQMKL